MALVNLEERDDMPCVYALQSDPEDLPLLFAEFEGAQLEARRLNPDVTWEYNQASDTWWGNPRSLSIYCLTLHRLVSWRFDDSEDV